VPVSSLLLVRALLSVFAENHKVTANPEALLFGPPGKCVEILLREGAEIDLKKDQNMGLFGTSKIAQNPKSACELVFSGTGFSG